MLLRYDPFRDLGRRQSHSIPFDAAQNDNELVLQFDLPGYDADDVELTVERGVLHLSAERSSETPESSKVLRRERYHGEVSRWLRLGDQYDSGQADAGFDNGVLTITVPVAATAKPHRVEIIAGVTEDVEEPAGV